MVYLYRLMCFILKCPSLVLENMWEFNFNPAKFNFLEYFFKLYRIYLFLFSSSTFFFRLNIYTNLTRKLLFHLQRMLLRRRYIGKVRRHLWLMEALSCHGQRMKQWRHCVPFILQLKKQRCRAITNGLEQSCVMENTR